MRIAIIITCFLHRYSHETIRAARERKGENEAEMPSKGEKRQRVRRVRNKPRESRIPKFGKTVHETRDASRENSQPANGLEVKVYERKR